MDMHESYNKLVIARAILVPHIGYWHGSDVELKPLKPAALGLYVTTVPCNNLRVALVALGDKQTLQSMGWLPPGTCGTGL